MPLPRCIFIYRYLWLIQIRALFPFDTVRSYSSPPPVSVVPSSSGDSATAAAALIKEMVCMQSLSSCPQDPEAVKVLLLFSKIYFQVFFVSTPRNTSSKDSSAQRGCLISINDF